MSFLINYRTAEEKSRWFSYARRKVTDVETTKKLGAGVSFERIRRITGYLVGTMEKWNNAKRSEERDRVKHSLTPVQ